MKFYSSIDSSYDLIFPLKMDQVFFTENQIPIKNSKLLDVGCATGQLAFQLASIGYTVNAFDLDEGMIKQARKRSQNDNVDFRVMNMLNIADAYSDHSFDGILCYGNTLVHLTKPGEIEIFLTGVHSLLKEKGMFLCQILNYALIVNEKIDVLPLIENEKIRFQRNYVFQKNGLINFKTNLLIKESRQIIENEMELLPVSKEDLEKLLAKTGFRNVEVFRNFKGDMFNGEELPLIIKAEK